MRDPYLVLAQKEEHAARVRREIQALLIVVPLLLEEAPRWEELKLHLSNLYAADPKPTEAELSDLKLYYPFIGNLGLESKPFQASLKMTREASGEE